MTLLMSDFSISRQSDCLSALGVDQGDQKYCGGNHTHVLLFEAWRSFPRKLSYFLRMSSEITECRTVWFLPFWQGCSFTLLWSHFAARRGSPSGLLYNPSGAFG